MIAGKAGDAGRRRAIEGAADELDEALAELRDLARGIHPTAVVQGGLASAVEALAERTPLPVPTVLLGASRGWDTLADPCEDLRGWEVPTMDEAVIRDRLRDHWQFDGVDYDKSHEIYHDDAVLEFPQSGERFVGKQNFLTWRRKYPAKLEFRIRRIDHDGDLWVAENLISYDGSPYMFTVNILAFRGDKVAHERLYVFEGFEAAAWRAEWAERFDPLESKSPQEWRESTEAEPRQR